MRRWQIGSQVPLLHIGPCSPFSLTRAARNLESLPHGPSLKLYFMTEVIQFPITSSTPSLAQNERFPKLFLEFQGFLDFNQKTPQ